MTSGSTNAIVHFDQNTMKIKPQTSREYFKGLNALFIGLLIFQIGFFVAAIVLANPASTQRSYLVEMLFVFVPVLAIGATAVSSYYFDIELEHLKCLHPLKEKMVGYLDATLTKYAILETPALLSIIAYFMTLNPFFLGTALFMGIVLLFHKPSKVKAISDLGLNKHDRQQVEDPNEIVSEVKTR
ncbi:hypothetical protein GCM10028791_18500 [Echinicola sediminis]